jgi:hypothetical protein
MTQRVEQVLPVLKRLSRMKPADRKKYIGSCSSGFIHQLCECISNLIKGNVPVNMKHLTCLHRHKQSLRKLASKSTALGARKKLLQKGGFLTFLLKPLIAGLVSLFGGFIANRSTTNNNAER